MSRGVHGVATVAVKKTITVQRRTMNMKNGSDFPGFRFLGTIRLLT